jgi:hypothetical protein
VADNTDSIILAFTENLMIGVRIEGAAQNLGYSVKFVENSRDIATDENDLSLPITSNKDINQIGKLIDLISGCRPALIIFDLDSRELPWRDWLPIIKSDPASRRYPVLCFGPHKRVDELTLARQLGADWVVARSRFMKELATFISKYAAVEKSEDLLDSCDQDISDKALRGIELFNNGKYFDAHEYLEEAWFNDASKGRELYRAILQIAVAYFHIERHNFSGAVKMFWRVRQWIEPLPDTCRGVNVASLRIDSRTVYKVLTSMGREGIAEFDMSLLKPVLYDYP